MTWLLFHRTCLNVYIETFGGFCMVRRLSLFALCGWFELVSLFVQFDS